MKYRFQPQTDSSDRLGSRIAQICRSVSASQPVPMIVCVGTDRSTGDSLGPLTGWHLKKQRVKAEVRGTLSSPVHASNLEDCIEDLQHRGPIIAVDACLGAKRHVGTVSLCREPLRPGAGVNKDLPTIGDFHITGTVNTSGFMEYHVLQNTRLSLVMSLAQWIARGISCCLYELKAQKREKQPAGTELKTSLKRWHRQIASTSTDKSDL